MSVLDPSPPEPMGLLVSAIRRGVRQLLERRIEGTGLSTTEFWILVGIAERPDRPQSELAARLRLDEGTTCRIVRTLRARDLVTGRRPPEDRRCLLLGLAPAGAALAAKLVPIAREVRGAVEAPLAPHERDQVRAALTKIVSSLARDVAAATPSPLPSLRPHRQPARRS